MRDAADVPQQATIIRFIRIKQERQRRNPHRRPVTCSIFTACSSERPMHACGQITHCLCSARADATNTAGGEPLHKVTGNGFWINAAMLGDGLTSSQSKLRIVREDGPIWNYKVKCPLG